ncbi:MAG: hypothetical protein L0Y60_02900 [Beijerinckiaceae bacterium]|nr:hypothetical protein [Beijerinckiaceae bacterium]
MRVLAVIFLAIPCFTSSIAVRAADQELEFSRHTATLRNADHAGVPCSVGAPFWEPPAATAAELPWPSVWLGHFSGGRHFTNAYGVTLVDWRDEKVCFPTQRECLAWIAGLRHAYHRPEGFWTCLVLR